MNIKSKVTRSRELAEKLGFKYSDLNMKNIFLLCFFLQEEFEKNKYLCLSVIPPNQLLLGKIQRAGIEHYPSFEIKVSGSYFSIRPGIHFRNDGKISFCGWADIENLTRFTNAFETWLRIIKRAEQVENG